MVPMQVCEVPEAIVGDHQRLVQPGVFQHKSIGRLAARTDHVAGAAGRDIHAARPQGRLIWTLAAHGGALVQEHLHGQILAPFATPLLDQFQSLDRPEAARRDHVGAIDDDATQRWWQRIGLSTSGASHVAIVPDRVAARQANVRHPWAASHPSPASQPHLPNVLPRGLQTQTDRAPAGSRRSAGRRSQTTSSRQCRCRLRP